MNKPQIEKNLGDKSEDERDNQNQIPTKKSSHKGQAIVIDELMQSFSALRSHIQSPFTRYKNGLEIKDGIM